MTHSDCILYREEQAREAEDYNRKHGNGINKACPRCDMLLDSAGICPNLHNIDHHHPPGSPARISHDKALSKAAREQIQ